MRFAAIARRWDSKVLPKSCIAVSRSRDNVRRCAHGKMFFNRVDQLRNAYRLCKKWMALDTETTLCLGSGHQRRKKNDWCILQFRIVLYSCCYFAAVGLWHNDIQQALVSPTVPSSLVT